MQVTPHGGLANRCTRPLCDLSVADSGRNPIMGIRLRRPRPPADPRSPTMLSADLRKLLIAQIGNELAAHALYLAIAIYFERQGLDRWGKLFREQSVEEAQHAQKIIDFLVDNDVDFDLPA